MMSNIDQAKLFLKDKKEENDLVIEIDKEENCINLMEESSQGIEFSEILIDENLQKLYSYLDTEGIFYHVREISYIQI